MSLPVRYEGVVKRYENGVVAMRGVDLTIEAGKVTVVLGPSGAGKSTLLRLANGLELPSEGKVWIGDTLVTSNNLREVRRKVGMIFQQFNLVPRLSVTANVLCGRLAYRSWINSLFFMFPQADFAMAEEAVGRVGLTERAWQRADRLSGGQQQRVAIARTLVQQAQVVLADEPVASLDQATSREVMDLMVEAVKSRNATLIVNLHQVDLAKAYADRIVGVRKGQILFDVLPQDLDETRIAELYEGPA